MGGIKYSESWIRVIHINGPRIKGMASILRGEPHKDSTSVNFHLSSLSLDFWGTYHRWVKSCFYIGNNQVGVYFIWCLSILRLHWVHKLFFFSEPLVKVSEFLPMVGASASWCDVEKFWGWNHFIKLSLYWNNSSSSCQRLVEKARADVMLRKL